jgi:hypothetical protein
LVTAVFLGKVSVLIDVARNLDYLSLALQPPSCDWYPDSTRPATGTKRPVGREIPETTRLAPQPLSDIVILR